MYLGCSWDGLVLFGYTLHLKYTLPWLSELCVNKFTHDGQHRHHSPMHNGDWCEVKWWAGLWCDIRLAFMIACDLMRSWSLWWAMMWWEVAICDGIQSGVRLKHITGYNVVIFKCVKGDLNRFYDGWRQCWLDLIQLHFNRRMLWILSTQN